MGVVRPQTDENLPQRRSEKHLEASWACPSTKFISIHTLLALWNDKIGELTGIVVIKSG
jgi:hypothetical protein